MVLPRTLHAAWAVALLAIAMPFAPEARAQASVPEEGGGSWTLAGQNVIVHDHTDYLGIRGQFGKTDTQMLFLGLDYGLTDKLAVNVGVPYVRSRYVGTSPHLHGAFPGHENDPVIDDGRYHGGLQDLGLGVRYQLWTDPVLVTPFIYMGYPSRDYPFRGHSAIGKRLRRVELGAYVAKELEAPLDAFYLQASYGYSINEETEGISVRSSKFDLGVDYLLMPRLSVRVFATWLYTHNGLNVPVDFPPAPDPRFYAHDRLLKTEMLNLGGGFSFMLSPGYTLFGTWLTTTDSKNAHAIHNSFTLAISRSF
jgi:hypothetical protein